MPQPIVHYEIAAKDLPALKRFYTDFLGWDIQAFGPAGDQAGDYEMIDGKQGAAFGIDGGMYPVGQDGDVPGVRLYANVDSADAYAGRIESLGGTVIVQPMEVPGAGIKVALFLDPEGNPIGVVETLQRS